MYTRTFLRWWETLSRPERIVAMSLAAGSVVAITNSTVWAVATCYMARQKALCAQRIQPEQSAAPGASAGSERTPAPTRDTVPSALSGHQV